jgi:hypothetical protein
MELIMSGMRAFVAIMMMLAPIQISIGLAQIQSGSNEVLLSMPIETLSWKLLT